MSPRFIMYTVLVVIVIIAIIALADAQPVLVPLGLKQ